MECFYNNVFFFIIPPVPNMILLAVRGRRVSLTNWGPGTHPLCTIPLRTLLTPYKGSRVHAGAPDSAARGGRSLNHAVLSGALAIQNSRFGPNPAREAPNPAKRAQECFSLSQGGVDAVNLEPACP